MAKQRRTISNPFQSIDGAALAWVVGGRITPRKGLDPGIAQGVTTLAKTISEVGQVLQQQKQKKEAETSQMMQQMMAGRGR